VLWKIFGGLPIDSINAIEKIAIENKNPYLGADSQDYVDLFIEAWAQFKIIGGEGSRAVAGGHLGGPGEIRSLSLK
jgi:hypothetical protein